MLHTKAKSIKRVIPRWREWRRDLRGAIATDSVNSLYGGKQNVQLITDNLESNFAAYKLNRNSHVASRLLNAAVLTSKSDMAKELALDIVERNDLQPFAINQARNVLQPNYEYNPVFDRKIIEKNIKDIKLLLKEHPRSSIFWIERARLHTILGQLDSGYKSVRCALAISPFNRYVVRSAVRFFIHYELWDEAWYYAVRAATANRDPWLQSLAVSVGSNSNVNKHIRGMRGSAKLPDSQMSEFSLSELNEAIATIELESGNETNAKRIFRQAWVDPASTVVSHGVWVLNEKLPGIKDRVHLDIEKSIQAKAYSAYREHDYDEALLGFRTWALEEPYSSEPYIYMTTICTEQEDFDGAIMAADRGLASNPNDETLINNRLYAKLRSRDKRLMASADSDVLALLNIDDFEEHPACVATVGMYRMLNGEEEEGIMLYRSALRRFRKDKDYNSYLICLSNFATNFMLLYNAYNFGQYKLLMKELGRSDDPMIVDARQMLFDEFSRHENLLDLEDKDVRVSGLLDE